MFEAHSAEDLLGWWRSVGPPWDKSLNEIEEEEEEEEEEDDESESDFPVEREGDKEMMLTVEIFEIAL
eukprot:scaffold6251_cov52-Attheya_sp.AAC.7